jgi:uncharacterized repeat protein (TIGR01451 family)
VKKVPLSDLSVSKSASPSPDGVSQSLTYKVTATNLGPQSAPSVVLTDNLPADVTFQSATASNTKVTCALKSGNAVSCPIGTLNVGKHVTVTIIVTTPAVAEPVLNSASVASRAIVDPNQANNTAQVETLIQGQDQWADLAITNTDNPDPASLSAGDEIDYTLQVTNNGPNPAPTSLSVVDTLPSSVTFRAVQATGWSCQRGDTSPVTITCTLSALDGPASPIDIFVTPNQTGVISNTATVSSSADYDPATSNNTATAQTTVNP